LKVKGHGQNAENSLKKRGDALTRPRDQGLDLSEMAHMSGSQVLNRILELEEAREVVQALSPQDYYWLIKKVGEDDCLPLLELGHSRQWHHVMDLELWQKDRLDLDQASEWMKRLQLANTVELAKWLYTEGQHFAYYYFFKMLDVRIIRHDDVVDVPEGFFSFDGVFYVKPRDPELQETLQKVLEAMASMDLERYHTLLLGLSGVLPAELEEEMFRLRNVRLAEYGFLPFDEAMSIYSGLPPETLTMAETESKEGVVTVEDEDVRSIIPLSPFYHTQDRTMLAQVASRIHDEGFLDRLRLEFAGLCNQILSAEGLRVDHFDVLIKTCRRAAGYVNVALEKLSKRDIVLAENLLRKNSLFHVFRVGFGLALRVKWETERWLKDSWFRRAGFPLSFWGERWGAVLGGLVEKKPLYYVGDKEEGELYRDFESPEEIEEVHLISMGCRVMDRVLEKVAETVELGEVIREEPDITFHVILFNIWAHHILGHELTADPLSMEEARSFFHRIRGKNRSRPYKMPGFREQFVAYFATLNPLLEQQDLTFLQHTLSALWEEFLQEYQWVHIDDLDARFSRLVKIRPSP